MLMGRDTKARVRGAMDAYHPAALRLIPKVSIKSGMRGPAEAQFIPRHERMRTIIPSITNRYRLLLFKEGSFYPTISTVILNDTPMEYSVSILPTKGLLIGNGQEEERSLPPLDIMLATK
jgi:hypothetical protein